MKRVKNKDQGIKTKDGFWWRSIQR